MQFIYTYYHSNKCFEMLNVSQCCVYSHLVVNYVFIAKSNSKKKKEDNNKINNNKNNSNNTNNNNYSYIG